MRPGVPLSLEDAQRIVDYITPLDKLEGREAAIFAEGDRKLNEARLKRQQRRQQARQAAASGMETLATVH